jgi:GxxExxY protein
MKTNDELNKITAQILDACITVHKEMGPGLLESVYELCLMKEFELRGIKAKNQILIPLFYKSYELFQRV